MRNWGAANCEIWTAASQKYTHKHTQLHYVQQITVSLSVSFQHKNKSTWVILWQWTIELDNKSDFNINYIFFRINYELKIICLKGLLVCIHFSHEALISTTKLDRGPGLSSPPSVPGNIQTVEVSQQRLEVLLWARVKRHNHQNLTKKNSFQVQYDLDCHTDQNNSNYYFYYNQLQCDNQGDF